MNRRIRSPPNLPAPADADTTADLPFYRPHWGCPPAPGSPRGILTTLMVEIGTTGWPWRGVRHRDRHRPRRRGRRRPRRLVRRPDRPPGHRRGLGPRRRTAAAARPGPRRRRRPGGHRGRGAARHPRDARVGILGWQPGRRSAARAARTLASLADLAPDRAVVALEGDAPVLRGGRRRAAAPRRRARRARRPARGRGRARLGLDRARRSPPDELAKAAGDAGVTGPVGVHLPVLVHDDAEIARRALHAPLLAPLLDAVPADGMVVGDPTGSTP